MLGAIVLVQLDRAALSCKAPEHWVKEDGLAPTFPSQNAQLLCCLPSVSDTFLSLQLWRETIDGLVSHSLKLRSLLGLPEKDTCVDVLPEETGKWCF